MFLLLVCVLQKPAGWPEAWAEWGKLGNPKNPKTPNAKTGRSWARPTLQEILEGVGSFYRIRSEVSGNRLQNPGWLARSLGWLGEARKSINPKNQKIQKLEKVLPIWSNPKRNLFILRNFVRSFRCKAPEVKLAGKKPGLTGGSSEIKKSTKSKNSKS